MMAADESCAWEPTGDVEVVAARTVTHGGAVQEDGMPWTDEATARMQRIPGFVRAVVMGRIEDFARRNGFSTITPEVMDTVRREMPVDFSKKMPFFMKQ